MSKDILYPLRVLHGKWHESILKYQIYWDLRNKIKEFNKKDQKFVFLVLTPQHGNLGDHAITQTEINVIKSIGVDFIEITDKQLGDLKAINMLNIMNAHPILINGGGNLGTLWFNVETMMRNIIEHNPKSPIFIFPNTIYYENTDWGKAEFEKSKNIYNRHPNLHLYAREKTSYDVMSQAYNNVRLVPDMVLSLNHREFKSDRNGCLLCLRGDIEKTRSGERDMIIQNQVKQIFGNNITVTDTVLNHGVTPAERESVLNEKFMQFASAELVVTDRLHGMIFCAITGTPCIVVNSKSPKVKGCYEWIKHLEYIKFADDVSDISELFNNIPKKEYRYDNSYLSDYYDLLINDILKELK